MGEYRRHESIHMCLCDLVLKHTDINIQNLLLKYTTHKQFWRTWTNWNLNIKPSHTYTDAMISLAEMKEWMNECAKKCEEEIGLFYLFVDFNAWLYEASNSEENTVWKSSKSYDTGGWKKIMKKKTERKSCDKNI